MKKIILLLLSVLFIQLNSNAQSWSPVGSGVSSSADALNVYNGKLIAAGRYSSMTSWDGSNWTSNGGPSATSIFVDGSDIYTGGQFTGGDGAKVISHFNGTAWSVLGSGINAYTLIYWNTNYRWWNIFKYNNKIYGVYDRGVFLFDSGVQQFVNVGNQITDLGEEISSTRYAGTINNVAYFSGMTNGIQRVFTWNDAKWDTLNLSNYPSRGITSMKVMNNELYIAGGFQNKNSSLSSMLKWNGTTLVSVLGYGAGVPTIYELYATKTHLYARYYSSEAHLGIWNGSSIVNLGTIFAGSLNAIEDVNGITYAGGFFTSFDGVTGNNIVQRTLTIGINKVLENDVMSIYPNPVIDRLTIDYPSFSEKNKTLVELLSIDGKVVKNIDILGRTNLINISSLSSGIYFLKISNSNGIRTTKIVKE